MQSIDNTWGGTYNQDDPGINSNGYVSVNNSNVRWHTGTAKLSAVKDDVATNYCLLHMTGKYEHWVVAYSASGDTAEDINVMDPYFGEYVTLKKALETEGATTIDVNRVTYEV